MVFDDAGGVKLPHGRFSSNDTWDVEAEFIDALLKINKNDIREHLESVPATINDNLTPVPNLTRVAHSRLGKFVFVDLWLGPGLLLCVEYEDVIYNPLLSIALSTTKYDEILAELCGRMAVPC